MKIKILLFIGFFCSLKHVSAQPGTLDESFGNKGVVRSDIGSGVSYSSVTKQVLLQSDGSIYVIFESAGLTLIEKKHPDGSTDSTYGNEGISTSVEIKNSHAALQKDGKIIVGGSLRASDSHYDISSGLNIENIDFPLARYNVDGTLDHTFDEDGKLTTRLIKRSQDDVSSIAILGSIVIQNDGKIVAVGYASIYDTTIAYDSTNDNYDYSHISDNIAIVRYNTDGSLDSTFNKEGKLITQLQINSSFNSVAIQSNGKIIVAGSGDNRLNLTKYNSNGTIDSTLNLKNYLKNTDNSYFAAKSIAIQSDGKIVLGGDWGNKISNNDFVLVRFNISGSLDNTFGKTGIQTTDFRTYTDVVNSIAIQNDGKILAAGYASNGSNDAFAIARYNTNGSLDNTFDTDGKKMTYVSSYNIYAISVGIQNTGKIIVAGYSQSTTSTNIVITKYNTDGSLDNTFNRVGTLIDYFKQKNTVFINSAVQKDGKIVSIGYTWNGTNSDFAIARYTSYGNLDNTFSSDGIQTTDFGSDEAAEAITLQIDGKIVVAGGKVLVRYNTDGSLDNTFSSDGKRTLSFEVSIVKIQQDGKILAGGGTSLARYNIDGSLDDSFNATGVITTTFSLENITLQNDGKIVLGGGYQDQISIVRYNLDGSEDSTFNMQNNLWFGSDGDGSVELKKIIIQKDGKIIAGGLSIRQEGKGFVSIYVFIARYNTDGSLDSTFAENGIFRDNGGSSSSCTVTLQNDGKILVNSNLFAYVDNDGETKSIGFRIIRLNNNGTYDNTFGTKGTTFPQLDQIVKIKNIVVADNKLYAIGYGTSVSNFGFLARYKLTDNKTPTVKLTTPTNNAVYTSPATITLNATATDADGTISSVKFYNGGTLLSTDSTSPYSYTLTNLAAGNYSFVAKATDNNGGRSSSASVAVSVSSPVNKAPVVSITTPANNAVYNAPATITINATATDSNGNVSFVRFYNGGTLLKTDSTSPYTCTVSNLSAGNYSFVAKATDNKGLTGSSSSVAVAVSASANKAPVVSITSPDRNAAYTAPASITINASASDADGTIASVKFYSGATLLTTDFTSPYTYTLSNAAAGTYSFTAKATDNKGLFSSSASVVVTVVAALNKAPVVSITSPANNAVYNSPAAITIHAAATDADGKISNVKFYNGSTLLATDSTSPYSYTFSNPPLGSYAVTAKATDNLGLFSSSATSSITVSASANNAPVVGTTSPRNNVVSAVVNLKVSNSLIVSSKPYSKTEKTALKDALSLRLSPNPATNIININIRGLQADKPATLSIISLSGNVLKTIRISNAVTQLDISSLASGVYTIKIISGGQILHRQLVKL